MLRLIVPLVIALVGLGGGVFMGAMLKPEPMAEEMAKMDGDKKGGKMQGDHGDGHGKGDSEGHDDKGYGDDDHDDYEEDEYEAEYDPEDPEPVEYFELSRKLIVPIIEDNGDRAFVAMELHLELKEGGAKKAETHEPKIRDALLRTVIAFAHTGAFDDDAHPNETFKELAKELKRAAKRVLGDKVKSVLIGDLIKQGA
ncbi:MAG: flagellar basal body-associated FliL family protein [Rhodobacteraceae bacterium]|nr:flagellar basal body-associated FliL family protein [Paracoccaceae bacterium]